MNTVIIGLGFTQVLLPIALIAANTLIPSASRFGLGLRSGALFLLLIYAALAGLWLFPPWWTPYLFMGLLMIGAIFRYGRIRHATHRWIRRTEQTAAALALVGAALVLVPALQGRSAPDDTVDLAMPVGPGRYLVLNGGTTDPINAHLFTLTAETARAYRGQSYAIDIIGIDRFGLRADGISPVDPTAYQIYGTPVRAPCTGTIVQRIDGVADMPVPVMDRENMTGNSVMIDCDGYVVLLAHLAANSIAVELGQSVQTGTLIGQVGNSGNTGEPHLHIHVQSALPDDDPISANPLWFTLDGQFFVRNDRFTVDE
ncbi:Peptidase family M23 [Cognatiyoonia koreensis]|uniref:Peptidase family M23 n=1 Tax=Cognatiyoonia koreensis TaxID=364200 RepID=A0A1I0RHU1_9RHOB|nr:M23 family metallopeptidase [Cognatiyoonia koreensis]SEW40495.1 Peptidase family M23 [Cognatiyoonia koreensis]